MYPNAALNRALSNEYRCRVRRHAEARSKRRYIVNAVLTAVLSFLVR
jgi:hypothetical protein